MHRPIHRSDDERVRGVEAFRDETDEVGHTADSLQFDDHGRARAADDLAEFQAHREGQRALPDTAEIRERGSEVVATDA